MRSPSFSLLLLTIVLAAGAWPRNASAAVEHFVLDPVHTRIAFRVAHLGLSQAIGTFSGANGTLDFDPYDWRDAKLEVNIPLDRLDMGDADWKKKVLSHTFLDAAKHPVAHFISTKLEQLDKTHAKVTGTLSLRGHEATVVLDVTLNGMTRSMYTLFRKTAGFSAAATIHRSADFGMDAYPDVVGDAVALDIQAEAEVRAPPADKPAEPSTPAQENHR